MRAVALFDSPAKSGLRTQPIESQLSRGAARYGRSQFTFTPRFDVLKTELLPSDEAALRYAHRLLARRARHHHPRRRPRRLAAHLRPQPQGVRRQLRVVARRARRRWPTTSPSRSTFREARVHVEGRGSDEPVNQRQGCRQPRRQSPRRDRDRRRALRSQRAARARDAPAASRRRLETAGVVLRGPGSAQWRATCARRARRRSAPATQLVRRRVADARHPLADAGSRRRAGDRVDQDRHPARAGPDAPSSPSTASR